MLFRTCQQLLTNKKKFPQKQKKIFVYQKKLFNHSGHSSCKRLSKRPEISTVTLSFLLSLSFFLDSRSFPANFALGKTSSCFLLSKDLRKASYFGRTLMQFSYASCLFYIFCSFIALQSFFIDSGYIVLITSTRYCLLMVCLSDISGMQHMIEGFSFTLFHKTLAVTS